MDQAALAGPGNLLVDEILWRSRVNPARKCDRLKEKERAAIFREMRRVLRAAIPTGRAPPRRSWLPPSGVPAASQQPFDADQAIDLTPQ